MIRITDTVKHLVIINVLFWVATIAFRDYGELFNGLFAFHFPLNEKFEFWQIFTHMFMHETYAQSFDGKISVTFMHLLFNMLALWMFGSPLEQLWGRNKFLFFYFSAGLGALLLSFLISYTEFRMDIAPLINNGFAKEDIISLISDGQYDKRWAEFISQDNLGDLFQIYQTRLLGASGAIMGILVAFGMLFPNAELMLIFFPVPIKAKYFIPAVIGLDIFSGLTGISIFSPSNTAYWAHVGGALIGLIIMLIWKKNQFNDKRWN